MRKGEFFGDGYYHIYNRGLEKRNIFIDDKDRLRFLGNIFMLQGPVSIVPFGRAIDQVIEPYFNGLLAQPNRFCKRALDKLENERLAEVIAFTLMPNHFHLIVHESKEGGVSSYMARLGNAYTKYFNARYKRKGYVFEGTCNSIMVDSEKYLTYLSAYIHKNVLELKEWKNKESIYPWSSFSDFYKKNRWGLLLKREYILDQFDSQEEYKSFVEELPIKEHSNLHNLTGFAKWTRK